MNPLPFLLQVMPFVAFVGTFLLILAYDRSHMPERVRTRGTQTEGTVVEIRRNPGSLFSSKAGKGEAPVVDFATNWGTQRHYSTDYTTPCLYKVGQKVKVRYYFRKSRREVALDGEGVGTLPGSLYRWGIMLCLIGYPFLIKKLMLFGGS